MTIPRRFNLTKILKAKWESHQLDSQTRLENIYFDLHNIYQSALSSTTYKCHNPFISYFQWTEELKERFQKADLFPGREIVAIVMHSPNFFLAMGSLQELHWQALLHLISENRPSLRMFALMRSIPYVLNYDHSPMPSEIGPLPPHAYGRAPGILLRARHPHEVYLTKNNDIARCAIHGLKIVNIAQSIYDEDVFRELQKGEEWPQKWPYPRDPTFVAPMPNGLFPRCWKCKKSMAPTHPGPQQPSWLVSDQEPCTCTAKDIFKEPLVEIREFNPLPGDTHTLNRGVRTLSRISKGDILAEYVGDVVPKAAENAMGDNAYLFDIWGPPRMAIHATTGLEIFEFGPAVALVSAAWRGNWTRFMNQDTEGRHNVEFETQVIGYKVRILAIARRDVPFGEELTVNNGRDYFSVGADDSTS
jgi:hypothetical protein